MTPVRAPILALTDGATSDRERADDRMRRHERRDDLPARPSRSTPPSERAAFLDEACGGDAGAARRGSRPCSRRTSGPASFLDAPAVGRGRRSIAPRRPAERPGTVIGPYKLLEPIGEGGMGVVYMAEQTGPSAARWP